LIAAATRAATCEIVALAGFAPGTIVVKTAERQLYFSLDGYQALRFPVGVGEAGTQWSGVIRVAANMRGRRGRHRK
jgi:lipoprotein-anchoring transpeptidase ErfK/SrfK